MKILTIANKFINKLVFGYKASSKSYIKYLRENGALVGNGVYFYNSPSINIATTELYLLEIGNNVQITSGVSILTHDYGWAVTKGIYADVLGSARPIKIGNNVYIGSNATILAGSVIEDNCIIGANSLVNGHIPSGSVAVGNPCKVIYTIDEYHKRRIKEQEKEAVAIIQMYYNHIGKIPSKEVLNEHFWLFENEKDCLPKEFINQNNLILGSEEQTWINFSKHEKAFKNYDELVNYALSRRGN